MLSVVSGLLTLAAFMPYIRSILKKETVPNTVSWWIWAAVGTMLLWTYHDLGGQNAAGIGIAMGALVGQIVVAMLALRYGKGGATRMDVLCLAGAVCAGLVWWLTTFALLPHLLILVIDFFGWLPTFKKTLREPRSENTLSWLLWTLGACMALWGFEEQEFVTLLYPLYIAITDGIVLFVLLRAWNKGRTTVST